MNHRYDSPDEEHFLQLIQDFPVENPPTIDTALSTIFSRFDKLNPDRIVNLLSCHSSEQFTLIFSTLPLIVHDYLFRDILANAGHYRKNEDPGNGLVSFGIRQQFTCSPPDQIKERVKQVCSYLIIDDNDPVYNAVKFYQKFVLVHPFYDANGRIGRFIVETYLNFHGIGMLWKKLCANEKWLKKLNECHKRNNSHEYDKYLRFLVNYWQQFTFQEVD